MAPKSGMPLGWVGCVGFAFLLSNRSLFQSCALIVQCCLIVASAFTAELKKPDPLPSDALFDPTRVIQIEIRLDPKDWHELRISHRALSEEGGISLTERGYEYCRADITIDGRLMKS